MEITGVKGERGEGSGRELRRGCCPRDTRVVGRSAGRGRDVGDAPAKVTDRNECVTGSRREGHPAGKQRRAWLNCPRVWNTDLVSDELG